MESLCLEFKALERRQQKRFEELMVFIKKHVSHFPFESESDDADECNELLAGLENLLDIVTGLENVKSATSSQTAAKENKDRARAEALRNASLGKLTAAEEQLIKRSELAEVEPSIAKKRNQPIVHHLKCSVFWAILQSI